METKKCRRCGEEKPLDCFSRRGEGSVKKRINCKCKECIKEEADIVRQLRKTAPPIPKICDSCKLNPLTNPNLGPHRKKLQLDHDHDTGKFRGWICDNCNVALSRSGDNLQGVINLVNYLLQNHL